MNRGLLAKAAGESWRGTLLLAIGLILAQVMLVFALTTFRNQISIAWVRLPFLQDILRGLLGADIGRQFNPDLLISMAWVHPVILSLVWAHAVISCTRLPAGEVDRGTIDLLMGLPVSRWQVYTIGTLVWLIGGVLLVLAVAGGSAIGGHLVKSAVPINPRQLVIMSTNLAALYVAVAGLCCLASAMSDRRGRAIGAVVGLLLASFLLNYLAQFWKPAEQLSFLSMLHYYRPLAVLREAAWPTGDLVTLLGCGIIAWLAAGFVFARRDLATL